MKRIARRSIAVTRLFLFSGLLIGGADRQAAVPDHDRERGDVPGWVMITLMSAILVAGLLAIASPALKDLFDQAMAKVGS
ncbi:hypothetical protein ACIQC5_03460 [Paenarthrobacter sp. NPDC092416]|uniref:hypothetical protein n=1 Tax=Paenarthrobacter sp. NPDC092416 TaxID=3364386 RepID=UPI00382B8AA8